MIQTIKLSNGKSIPQIGVGTWTLKGDEAAIFEIGRPLGFKLSSTQPERFWSWITYAIISMALSGVFLYLAQL